MLKKKDARVPFGRTQAKAGTDREKVINTFMERVEGGIAMWYGLEYAEAFDRLNPSVVQYLPLGE